MKIVQIHKREKVNYMLKIFTIISKNNVYMMKKKCVKNVV